MHNLQQLVQTYLQSAGYNLLDTREGFVVADKLGFAGDRDTRLVWIPPPSTKVKDFSLLELNLLEEFEQLIPLYPNARYYIVAHTREGFSKEFLTEAKSLRINMRVPIQFFDTPFKHEEASGAATTIKALLDKDIIRKRVSQPYSILKDGVTQDQYTDLLSELLNKIIGEKEFWLPKKPCVRFVVGTAGIGKSVLFKALFTHLYKHFIEQKKRQRIFPRPIPLIPDYLHKVSTIRTEELINSFIHTDVAAPVSLSTFQWMLVNSFSIWLFDGLDELYAGDANFFDFLLDILTYTGSNAQVVIFARDSLLTTSDNFSRFMEDFYHGSEEMICLYKLDDWKYTSKRTFAWLSLEGTPPLKGHDDPIKVSQFLNIISGSSSLSSLSGLPYYCCLLMEEFKQGKVAEFTDDFELLDHAVSGIIEREIAKGLLLLDHFDGGYNGLIDWLETVALDLYVENFKGLSTVDVEEYAHLVLHPELSNEEQSHAITTLIQFPLFAPGIKPGVMTIKHELLGEYLVGKYLLKQINKNPLKVAKWLGSRLDFAESLIARYMASRLSGKSESIKIIINTLKSGALEGRYFANLLQLFLLVTPLQDVINNNEIVLESRDLRGVKFINKDLHGVSFRNCDLSNVLFNDCNLKNSKFEGAYFSETRFEKISKGSLSGARFGNLQNFESIYEDKHRIDNREKILKWVQKSTGIDEKITEPCPATFQLRVLFLKFFYPDGSARSIDLPESALIRGKRYPNAPKPEDCISASLRFGYLQGPDYRKRIKRTPGDRYNDVVIFVRDWNLTTGMRQLLNSLCPKNNCEHVPKSYSNNSNFKNLIK